MTPVNLRQVITVSLLYSRSLKGFNFTNIIMHLTLRQSLHWKAKLEKKKKKKKETFLQRKMLKSAALYKAMSRQTDT